MPFSDLRLLVGVRAAGAAERGQHTNQTKTVFTFLLTDSSFAAPGGALSVGSAIVGSRLLEFLLPRRTSCPASSIQGRIPVEVRVSGWRLRLHCSAWQDAGIFCMFGRRRSY